MLRGPYRTPWHAPHRESNGHHVHQRYLRGAQGIQSGAMHTDMLRGPHRTPWHAPHRDSNGTPSGVWGPRSARVEANGGQRPIQLLLRTRRLRDRNEDRHRASCQKKKVGKHTDKLPEVLYTCSFYPSGAMSHVGPKGVQGSQGRHGVLIFSYNCDHLNTYTIRYKYDKIWWLASSGRYLTLTRRRDSDDSNHNNSKQREKDHVNTCVEN